MTREDANITIDYLKEMQEEYIEGEGYERHPLPEWYALDKAIEAIEQTTWIPVSERLPETNDDVLVTDGVDMFVAWYSRKGMWQGWKSSDNNFERNTPIDAWMPLPSPYKGEQE